MGFLWLLIRSSSSDFFLAQVCLPALIACSFLFKVAITEVLTYEAHRKQDECQNHSACIIFCFLAIPFGVSHLVFGRFKGIGGWKVAQSWSDLANYHWCLVQNPCRGRWTEDRLDQKSPPCFWWFSNWCQLHGLNLAFCGLTNIQCGCHVAKYSGCAEVYITLWPVTVPRSGYYVVRSDGCVYFEICWKHCNFSSWSEIFPAVDEAGECSPAEMLLCYHFQLIKKINLQIPDRGSFTNTGSVASALCWLPFLLQTQLPGPCCMTEQGRSK